MWLMYKKDKGRKCKHADFAQSLLHLRLFIADYIKKGKIKEFEVGMSLFRALLDTQYMYFNQIKTRNVVE